MQPVIKLGHVPMNATMADFLADIAIQKLTQGISEDTVSVTWEVDSPFGGYITLRADFTAAV